MMTERPLHDFDRESVEERRGEKRRISICAMNTGASSSFALSHEPWDRNGLRTTVKGRELLLFVLFVSVFSWCSPALTLSTSAPEHSFRATASGPVHPLWGPKGAHRSGLRLTRSNIGRGGFGGGGGGGGARDGRGRKKTLVLRMRGGRLEEQDFSVQKSQQVAKEEQAKPETEDEEEDGMWGVEARREDAEDDGMWEVPSQEERTPTVKLLDGALMEGVRRLRRSHLCPHGIQRALCKVCGRGHRVCKHGAQKELCKAGCGSRFCKHKKQRAQCRECCGKNMCKHGRQRSQCRPCMGSNICQHLRQRSTCKDCRGSQICEHDRQRALCRLCRGSQICHHDRYRTTCKECRGSQICVHNRQRSICKDCRGSQVCEHLRQRSMCKDCGGSQICQHSRQRSSCRACRGSQICVHDRQRSMCRECHGSQVCSHRRLRGYCKECRGSQICDHNRQRAQCYDCKAESEAQLAPCQHLLQRSDVPAPLPPTPSLCPQCSPQGPNVTPRRRTRRSPALRSSPGPAHQEHDLPDTSLSPVPNGGDPDGTGTPAPEDGPPPLPGPRAGSGPRLESEAGRGFKLVVLGPGEMPVEVNLRR